MGQYIYISFLYSTLWASIGVFTIIFFQRNNLKMDISIFTLLIFTLICAYLIVISQIFWEGVGISCCKENKYELYLKLYSLVVIFIYSHYLIKKNIISFELIGKLFVWVILLSLVRYYYEFYNLIINLNVNENRPYPAWIGGWNTYGLLLSLAYVIILDNKKISLSWKVPILVILLVTILTVLSRGGLLFLVVALIYRKFFVNRYNIKDLKILFVISFFIFLVFVLYPNYFQVFYDRFIESFLVSQYENVGLLQSMSSGRTVHWQSMIDTMFTDNSIYQYIIGFGPGHFIFEQADGGFETTLANQYLDFVYEYGIVIFSIGFVYLIISYMRLKWKWGAFNSNMLTLKTIYLILLLTFVVESLIYQTQLIFFISLIFASVTNYKTILYNSEEFDR